MILYETSKDLCMDYIMLSFSVCLFTDTSMDSNNSPFIGGCIKYGIICNYLNQTTVYKGNEVLRPMNNSVFW